MSIIGRFIPPEPKPPKASTPTGQDEPESLRDKYTFKQECAVGGEEELQYTVWLKVGGQSFTLAGYHNEEEAEYFRTMLGKAVAAILKENKK